MKASPRVAEGKRARTHITALGTALLAKAVKINVAAPTGRPAVVAGSRGIDQRLIELDVSAPTQDEWRELTAR